MMDTSAFIDHLHTPPHLFTPNSIYLITGSTANKQPYLKAHLLKDNLIDILFEEAFRNGWELHAWVVLDNHYHFVAKAPADASTLTDLIRAVHSRSGKHINRFEGIIGRRVWYNYWDSCITNETSYLARLHYVNMNPIKHGLVEMAEDYPYSSYRWFIETAEPDFQKKVFSKPIDRINVHDNF
jgi:putative transposase